MRPLIVGIAGGSGSGKTMVARKVAESLTDVSVATVSMDAYYRNRTELSLDERKRLNFDHPDTLDLELLVSQMHALASGTTVRRPVYDFVAHPT